tara:strand:+ start:576 stop:917 length:342 start_codon:yes stop_codon:yes gene_type:complete
VDYNNNVRQNNNNPKTGTTKMKTLEQLKNIKARTTTAQKNKVLKIALIAIEHNEEIEILSSGYRYVQSTYNGEEGIIGVNFGQIKKLSIAQRALLVRTCESFDIALHQNLLEE